MKAIRLSTISAKDLLQLQADITLELRARGVVRTHNNPLGDYTERLVADALDLELADNSAAGYDGIAKDGTRVQIKGRRITGKSRQLSAIRNLDANEFDVLAAVLFDERFNVKKEAP